MHARCTLCHPPAVGASLRAHSPGSRGARRETARHCAPVKLRQDAERRLRRGDRRQKLCGAETGTAGLRLGPRPDQALQPHYESSSSPAPLQKKTEAGSSACVSPASSCPSPEARSSECCDRRRKQLPKLAWLFAAREHHARRHPATTHRRTDNQELLSY